MCQKLKPTDVISKLPYAKPFLFVDELTFLSENKAEGNFHFLPELDFYKGHFKDNPVTPGVILTECMAQIGLVSLGIYLLSDSENIKNLKIGLTSTEIEFLKPVYPDEKVQVLSEKIYFRFNKLKCKVQMLDSENDVVCRGSIAGMILNN
ncbi:hydroxymyristoyl-ACP dehydratase [Gramella sp. AN32]|uniref:3-hydroxyacyl-ACP dehydratase FabZ family protein n=1 Tax=Christiangramia antarctica TaxID=2058158 RepID=A0ABW5WY40_9FLAO|nr:hydroxymyristoyl-ACP dehydratase [Gramella sp. AN32]MCM4156811.1 hydroxymyristoyl-ACP dehydratase [Gramella sp. AN32]